MIHNLYLGLWYANPLFDILLLFVLFARRRARSFPFFTLCTITSTAEWIGVLYITLHHKDQLFQKVVWPLNFCQNAIFPVGRV